MRHHKECEDLAQEVVEDNLKVVIVFFYLLIT